MLAGGAGQTINDPCGGCQGRGQVSQDRTLSVSVPSGVEDGTRIRLSGEGNAGPGGGSAWRPLCVCETLHRMMC